MHVHVCYLPVGALSKTMKALSSSSSVSMDRSKLAISLRNGGRVNEYDWHCLLSLS